MSLARRNLFQNKVRLLLSAAGVALSVMLILILNGFLSGVGVVLLTIAALAAVLPVRQIASLDQATVFRI
jgi:hypothetical protein